jgi:hypothetical protein
MIYFLMEKGYEHDACVVDQSPGRSTIKGGHQGVHLGRHGTAEALVLANDEEEQQWKLELAEVVVRVVRR